MIEIKTTLERIKQGYLKNIEVVEEFENDFSFKYKHIPIKHKSFKALIKFVNKALTDEEIAEIYKEIRKIVFKTRK